MHVLTSWGNSSESGVLNVYERKSLLLSTSPKPLKALMNLTTPVKGIKFNPDTYVWLPVSLFNTVHSGYLPCSYGLTYCRQVVAYWSYDKKDAFKLVRTCVLQSALPVLTTTTGAPPVADRV